MFAFFSYLIGNVVYLFDASIIRLKRIHYGDGIQNGCMRERVYTYKKGATLTLNTKNVPALWSQIIRSREEKKGIKANLRRKRKPRIVFDSILLWCRDKNRKFIINFIESLLSY